jgi:hypothetical protein
VWLASVGMLFKIQHMSHVLVVMNENRAAKAESADVLLGRDAQVTPV